MKNKVCKFFYLVFMLLALCSRGGLLAQIYCLESSQEIIHMPRYYYPYYNLHLQLKEKGVETITIFSYGSLMDIQSASKTMSSKTLQSMKPAIAFGVKRLFNRDVPIKPNSKWGQPYNPSARGMLNVIPSESDHDFVNGVVFTVSIDEIPQILYREEGYDLLPVVVQDWKDAVGGQLSCYTAYTFSASTPYISDAIDPRPGYYELSRDAAGHYGPLFYSLWFQTTYQSDGLTRISGWEDRVKNQDPLTRAEPGL